MRRRRPKTKMVRVRIKDIQRAKEMARQAQKKLPDFWAELIKSYRRK